MLNFLKKKKPPDFAEVRELLFGDAPLSAVAPSLSAFVEAQQALERQDHAGAIAVLRPVTEATDRESRHKLQAWHLLRQLGVVPDQEIAKRVLGVVIEVSLPDGLDTLAAYADHSARYINHVGRLIVWETSEPTMNATIEAVLIAGQRIADAIGPWNGPRRAPPPRSHARLNMLTPSGLHFGEAPLSALTADALAGPVLTAGTRLMQALIAKAN